MTTPEEKLVDVAQILGAFNIQFLEWLADVAQILSVFMVRSIERLADVTQMLGVLNIRSPEQLADVTQFLSVFKREVWTLAYIFFSLHLPRWMQHQSNDASVPCQL